MTTLPEPHPTPNEDIARSYYLAMGEGQDWMSLPPASPFTAPELRLIAELMSDATLRSPAMLDLVNGTGSYTIRLRHLLARVWAAGAKSGVAMAHLAATPKDTPLFPIPAHTHVFSDTGDGSPCITDMFCTLTYSEFRERGCQP